MSDASANVRRGDASALSDVSGLRVELLWRVSWFLSGLGASDCWGVTLWVPDSGLGTGFSLWGCVNLSFWWAGAPWTVGVLVSDCVDLVWV